MLANNKHVWPGRAVYPFFKMVSEALVISSFSSGSVTVHQSTFRAFIENQLIACAPTVKRMLLKMLLWIWKLSKFDKLHTDYSDWAYFTHLNLKTVASKVLFLQGRRPGGICALKIVNNKEMKCSESFPCKSTIFEFGGECILVNIRAV